VVGKPALFTGWKTDEPQRSERFSGKASGCKKGI
jgi:hypothetical protein